MKAYGDAATEEGLEKGIQDYITEKRSSWKNEMEVRKILDGIETDLPIEYYISTATADYVYIAIWHQRSIDLSVEQVREVRKLLAGVGFHGSWKRNFDERFGHFSWTLHLDNQLGGTIQLTFSIQSSEVSGCQIIQYKEEVTRYKSSCSQEEVIENE